MINAGQTTWFDRVQSLVPQAYENLTLALVPIKNVMMSRIWVVVRVNLIPAYLKFEWNLKEKAVKIFRYSATCFLRDIKPHDLAQW